jgi:uncharacterized protein YbbK (DUF523 family)
MILVSACLAGIPCRYDGGSFPVPEIQRMVAEGHAVAICPEVAGGLPIPRLPAEIQGGDGQDVLEGRAKVVRQGGVDITEAFIKGAHQALSLARKVGAKKAILKARSPSCGVTFIHDGSFTGALREGMGVTAALLKREGIELEER